MRAEDASLEIIGRAAHSGLEPEKGRNAIIEASHQALQLGSLADPAKETTVNLTMIQGGNAINVIPDHAVIKADVRAFTTEEFDRVETGLRTLAGNMMVPEVEVKASMTRNFPPWPPASRPSEIASEISMNPSTHSELIRFARTDVGSTVIDVWPGSGDWTRLFSDIVGPEGRVYSFVPAELAHFKSDPVGRMRALGRARVMPSRCIG
jgi:metal-dependent amidase/aminoacylase/carboxypeptidase family protein